MEGLFTLIATLCTAGGVLYLLVEKMFSARRDKAETTTTIISNSNEVADLYRKIDEIVESKVAPIQKKLDDIEKNWCCYREDCEMRILTAYHKHEV